jgi:hypothetical protein
VSTSPKHTAAAASSEEILARGNNEVGKSLSLGNRCSDRELFVLLESLFATGYLKFPVEWILTARFELGRCCADVGEQRTKANWDIGSLRDKLKHGHRTVLSIQLPWCWVRVVVAVRMWTFLYLGIDDSHGICWRGCGLLCQQTTLAIHDFPLAGPQKHSPLSIAGSAAQCRKLLAGNLRVGGVNESECCGMKFPL